MAEAVAATVAFLSEGEVILTAFEAFAAAAAIELVAVTMVNNYAKRRAREKMRQAHNDNLRDRYVMGRSTITQRRIVLGRQRVSGNLAFLKSYGTNLGKIAWVLPLSAEEIDGVEAIYFDDEQVILDGSGNVTGVNRRELFSISSTGATFTLQSAPKSGSVSAVARYGTTVTTLGVSVVGKDVTVSGASSTLSGQVTISYQPETTAYLPTAAINATASIFTNGSGTGSVTLPNAPLAGSAQAVRLGNATIDTVDIDATALLSVVGNVATITGGAASVEYVVNYQYTETSRARIRIFTGAPGQVADPALIAALPGIWTSGHVGNGIAYLSGEFDYDPDAFPSSLPNVSALIRGSKVYDPRTGLTAWSENPALLTRHVATHPLGGRLAAARINDASFITAANVCDTSTAYVVNGRTYNRALYTAGTVLTSGTRADDVIQDLCEAMGGDRAFTDGQLRVKAGAWVTPLQTLDESWLIKEGGAVQSQRRRPVEEIANIITGAFADEENDYQVRDFPTVRSATYIAEDGEELPDDLDLNAITFSAQAQQVAAQRMRRKRFGRRISVTCNQRAFPVEWGDNIYVNLPTRYGFVNLPCEVLDVSFTIEGGIQLALEEIGPEIWAVSSSYAEVALRPNVFSPSPLEVPAVAGLAASSADAVQVRNADGTVVQRIRASWTAATSGAVLANDGGTEVRYGLASWPEAQWISRKAEGGATQIDLVGVQQGQVYLIKARHFNALVNGKWSLPILHVTGARSVAIDTPQLVANAATVPVIATGGGTKTQANVTSSSSLDPVTNYVTGSWVNNTGQTVTVQYEITAVVSVTRNAGSDPWLFPLVQLKYGPSTSLSSETTDLELTPDDVITTISIVRQGTVANGETAQAIFGMNWSWETPATRLGGTMTASQIACRVTAIKR